MGWITADGLLGTEGRYGRHWGIASETRRAETLKHRQTEKQDLAGFVVRPHKRYDRPQPRYAGYGGCGKNWLGLSPGLPYTEEAICSYFP